MFIASSNELAEFVDSLLLAPLNKDILAILKNEDEKQLTFAKNSMIQKMPKELHPQSNARSASPNNAQSSSFPTMFDSINKKTYEYINENIQNMKQIASSYMQMPKAFNEQTKRDVEGGPIEEPAEIIQTPPEAEIGKEMSIAKESHKENSRSVRSQFSLSKPQKPIKNPFVANSINFTDKFANSKSIQQKFEHLSFSQNSRNMVAMAQTAKYNAFSESVAFPTTVMAGTLLPPKENTFSRDSKLDVQDVMRYTLGAKKGSTSKMQTSNPFVRAPKKRE